MSLLSLSFALFFLAVLVVYYVVPQRFRWLCLLAASLAFYLCSDLRCFLFLLASIATTYAAGRLMAGLPQPRKKLVLAAALVLNIGCLAVLKYFGYTVAVVNDALRRMGAAGELRTFDLLMPLGVSYYTLAVAGYCVDVYRGKIEPEKNFLRYALFVSFFPQITQGPIPRYAQLAPQLAAPHPFRYKNLSDGLRLMLWGLFKKLVIADWLGVIVSTVFDAETFIGSQVILAAAAFSIQLYADFSGCVDIMRGCAQTFGVELAINFDRPYFATSIQDFWRRWHISLSTRLRDYVYIPLGGSRRGTARKYVNILLVFLVSGFWHGVGAQYLVWGLLHGLYQVLGALLKPLRTKLIDRTGTDRSTLGYRVLQILLTFGLVTFAWIFFRARSLGTALAMIASIPQNLQLHQLVGRSLLTLGLDAPRLCALAVALAVLLIVSILQEKGELRPRIDRQPLPVRWAIYLAGIAAILIFGKYGPSIDPSAFIYSQF